jgi:hypothetical protein
MVVEIDGLRDTKPRYGTVPGKSRVSSEMVNKVSVNFFCSFDILSTFHSTYSVFTLTVCYSSFRRSYTVFYHCYICSGFFDTSEFEHMYLSHVPLSLYHTGSNITVYLGEQYFPSILIKLCTFLLFLFYNIEIL